MASCWDVAELRPQPSLSASSLASRLLCWESGQGFRSTENHNSPDLGAVRDDFLKEVGLKREEEAMTGQ